MAGPCSADFERLAQELGDFGCAGQNAVVNLHNPFALDHWSLLVIEVAMLVGAGLALRHALRRRREGDPSGLAIWLASLAYLVIVEPPLYFPQNFGLQEQVGLIFVHNEFTVQFLWGRLPLYIVAAYPVLGFLAYELVRVVGVFERRSAFTSALSVGIVYQAFYEIFDHIGPQLRWWIWNPGAPTNEPMLASVPISSIVNFAVVGPIVLTFLVRVLVADRPNAATMTTGALVGRSAIAGFLMPIGLVLGGMPATLFSLGETTNHTGQAIAFWTTLGITLVVGVYALLDAHRNGGAIDDPQARRYLATHAAIFLGGLVIAWGAGLPAYLAATDGITADGTPIGSLAYAVVCFAFALGFLWLALSRTGAMRSAEAAETAPVPA